MRLSHVLTSTAAMTIAAVPSSAQAEVHQVPDHEACSDGTTLGAIPGQLLAQPVFGHGPATLAVPDVPADHIVVEAGGRQFTAVAAEDGSLVVATLAPVSQLVVCDQPARPVEVRGEVLINPDEEGAPEPQPSPSPTPIVVDGPVDGPAPEPTPTPEAPTTPAAPQPPTQPAAPTPPATPPAAEDEPEPDVVAREPDDAPAPVERPEPEDGPDPDPPAGDAVVPPADEIAGEEAPGQVTGDGTDPSEGPDAVVPTDAAADLDVEDVALDVVQPDVDDEDEDFEAYVQGLLAWVPASEDEPEDEDDPTGEDDEAGRDVREDDEVVEEPEPLLLHLGDDGDVEQLATPRFLTVGGDDEDDAPEASPTPLPRTDSSRGTGPARQAMFGLITLAGSKASLATPPSSWSFA